MAFHVYIIECDDGSHYVGHTRNVPKRFDTHLRGDGSSHTKRHLPEKIVYVETFESEAEAIKRERQIKKWSRAKKEALISGDMARLRELSKKRSERSA
jgi:putative endonuclease